ncbi:MAG TPA: transketolase family protein [Candidatus Deferrimicrobium sp.]|nr:transketolase family protein [Candidatus Deferrimicrobium sp.]
MTKIATRTAYGQTLVKLGEENENIVVLDADLSKSTKTADFAKKFPERFINAGIAEANLIGMAAGLAAAGKTPFASTFAIFAAGRAFEQIRNSVAYPKMNVKIAATHSGITVGEDGGSHQSVEDVALMRSLPNMTVIVPADAIDTAGAIKAAAAYQGPVYIRLGRLDVPVILPEDYKFELGKAVVLREGWDAAVFANGMMLGMALEAAEILSKQGIEIAVVNVATVKPLDVETIVEVSKQAGAVVTAEEHSILGGLGGAVAEVLVENCPVPMERVGLKDTFGESGAPTALLEKYGLTSEAIVKTVQKVITRKK